MRQFKWSLVVTLVVAMGFMVGTFESVGQAAQPTWQQTLDSAAKGAGKALARTRGRAIQLRRQVEQQYRRARSRRGSSKKLKRTIAALKQQGSQLDAIIRRLDAIDGPNAGLEKIARILNGHELRIQSNEARLDNLEGRVKTLEDKLKNGAGSMVGFDVGVTSRAWMTRKKFFVPTVDLGLRLKLGPNWNALVRGHVGIDTDDGHLVVGASVAFLHVWESGFGLGLAGTWLRDMGSPNLPSGERDAFTGGLEAGYKLTKSLTISVSAMGGGGRGPHGDEATALIGGGLTLSL